MLFRSFPVHSLPASGVRLDHEVTVEEMAERLPEQLDLKGTLARFERALLVRALTGSDGVQAQAARLLRMSRSDFGYKAAKYSLGGSSGTYDGKG